MKYEMIFGDQSLFDGAHDGAEMVGGLSDKCRLFYKIVGGDLYASFGKHDDFTREPNTKAKDIKVAAMRRIIAEPKRWTVEDQKAGRLPEVGAIVVSDGFNEECEFLGVGMVNGFFVVRLPNGLISINSASSFKPIGTPEEKAQREEDEFVKSEMKNTNLSMEWYCIYERGLRAAYRKLKGGE